MRSLSLSTRLAAAAATAVACLAVYVASGDYRRTPSSGASAGFGPAIGAPGCGRVPGQYEHQDALMLGVNELVVHHPQTLVEIIRAIQGRLQIVALVMDESQEKAVAELLVSHGLTTDGIHFFVWPASSMWVQDFGPQQVVNGDVRIIDFEYTPTGFEAENQLPLAFAATYGMKIKNCKLVLEGGNLLSNGRGLCISSTTLVDTNLGRYASVKEIGEVLKNELRFTMWSYLPPLVGEPTSHVDLFLTIAGPSSVVLASYDPADDPENSLLMDDHARQLAAISVDGQPMKVFRVEQPPAKDGIWRSYTNVIYANGVVLVPQYPDVSPELDRRALATFAEALPDWKVVGVDASTIISKRGSLHCLSLNLPSMPCLADR